MLLIVVAAWRKVRWLLEQPESSVLPLLPQWQWLLSVVEVRVNNFVAIFYVYNLVGIRFLLYPTSTYMEDHLHKKL